jgi:hypothetical protein
MGMTIPGKSTVLRSGSSDTSSGNASSLRLTSSSVERMGITFYYPFRKPPAAMISFIIFNRLQYKN